MYLAVFAVNFKAPSILYLSGSKVTTQNKDGADSQSRKYGIIILRFKIHNTESLEMRPCTTTHFFMCLLCQEEQKNTS